MRQVPHYLVIGNGRVARHVQHYFSLSHLVFSTWHRQQPLSELRLKLAAATHVLLLITDHAIEPFVTEHQQDASQYWIHFSGSLVTDKAWGAHPLMTFNHHLYDVVRYQAVPFVLDHDAPAFPDLLPGLTNAHVRLHVSLKAKYHALCVLSGNFSCLLWQKLFSAFENEFDMPKEMAHAYLSQQTHNLITHPDQALTGPLTRNDTVTIEKNMAALAGDAYQEVYKSFVACYQKITIGKNT